MTATGLALLDLVYFQYSTFYEERISPHMQFDQSRRKQPPLAYQPLVLAYACCQRQLRGKLRPGRCLLSSRTVLKINLWIISSNLTWFTFNKSELA